MRDHQNAQAQCQKRLARTLFHVSGEEPALWSSTTAEWLRLWFRCMALSAVAEKVRSIGPKAGERTAIGLQLRPSEGLPQLGTGVNRLPPSRLVKASPSSGGVVVDHWPSLCPLPPPPRHCQGNCTRRASYCKVMHTLHRRRDWLSLSPKLVICLQLADGGSSHGWVGIPFCHQNKN